jgi:hypothetical protein
MPRNGFSKLNFLVYNTHGRPILSHQIAIRWLSLDLRRIFAFLFANTQFMAGEMLPLPECGRHAESAAAAVIWKYQSDSRSGGNVGIPKGFPRRVGSQLFGFPCFPLFAISTAQLIAGSAF